MEQLHIETFGPDDGRDVVLIHGWPMSENLGNIKSLPSPKQVFA